MPMNLHKNIFTKAALTGMALSLVLIILSCGKQDEQKAGDKRGRVTPVEAVAIERGPISLFRTFNGTLAAKAEFMVAPKVSGRVEHLTVNLADTVKRGQVVAELDNGEYIQAVALAKADLTVTKANLVEAKSGLEIVNREFERVKTLKKRGVASESQFDSVMADQSAKQAQLEIAADGLAAGAHEVRVVAYSTGLVRQQVFRAERFEVK